MLETSRILISWKLALAFPAAAKRATVLRAIAAPIDLVLVLIAPPLA
jgi:hypothetical protein